MYQSPAFANWSLAIFLATHVLAQVPTADAVCLRYALQAVHPPPCSLLPAWASAYAVNQFGQLGGGYGSCNAGGGFIWTSGQFVAPLLVGGSPFNGGILGLNSAGQAVGTLYSPMRTGFLYEHGTLTLFGTFAGGTYSEATGIAEDGTVVGYWGNNVNGKPAAHGYLWRNGQMTDLNIPGD